MIKKVIMISIIMIIMLFRIDTIHANNYGLSNPKTSTGVSTWDCVYFGSYPQTSDENGGFNKESIKWRVLDVNGNDAFLMSDIILDTYPFHNKAGFITWDNSDIRSWLNNNFYNMAFNINEKGTIKNTFVKNDDNAYYNVDGGNDTYDKIYFLSESERKNSKYGFTYFDEYHKTKTLYCKVTDYAESRGCSRSLNYQYYMNGVWWLRTPGNIRYNSSTFLGVNIDGSSAGSGINSTSLKTGIRPVLHINLESNGWSHAGTVNSDGMEMHAKTVNTSIKKITSKKKGLVIKWKRAYGVKGYNIQCSISKKFKQAKIININKSSTTSKTIKKLKSKKKYFVRIRTYKIVSGKTYQSAWSKVKSKKTQ